MYAVDLSNNFLVFGSESFDVLTAKMRISGLPILKRIIGIAFRPSNGKLYGVGNDSRVYTIDPLTAVATPVSSGQFSPKIVGLLRHPLRDGLEPNGERVRLIAAESGANWSISLDDGTAVTGAPVHFAAGDPNEGETPHIASLVYRTPSPEAALSAGISRLASSSGPCTEVMYMIDPDLAQYIGSCDGDVGDLSTLGPIEESWSRCMETVTGPDGDVLPSPGNPVWPGKHLYRGDARHRRGQQLGHRQPERLHYLARQDAGQGDPDGDLRAGRALQPGQLRERPATAGAPHIGCREPESPEQSAPPSDPRAQCLGAAAR